mmetsp:Transcript_788/g.2249  ORF Transcript_788/g.2249 Transcript_788/m.2249 type:complete len:213 (-) Transcript_788:338-976(-)
MEGSDRKEKLEFGEAAGELGEAGGDVLEGVLLAAATTTVAVLTVVVLGYQLEEVIEVVAVGEGVSDVDEAVAAGDFLVDGDAAGVGFGDGTPRNCFEVVGLEERVQEPFFQDAAGVAVAGAAHVDELRVQEDDGFALVAADVVDESFAGDGLRRFRAYDEKGGVRREGRVSRKRCEPESLRHGAKALFPLVLGARGGAGVREVQTEPFELGS